MRKKRGSGKKSLKSKIDEASIRRRHEMIGIALVAVAVLSVCGLLGFNAGFVGLWLARLFNFFFGVGSWVFVLVLLWVGASHIMHHQETKLPVGFWGVFCFVAFGLALYHHFTVVPGEEILPDNLSKGGGLLGGGLLFLLRKVVGVQGGLVVMLAGLVSSFVWTTKWSLSSGILRTRDTAKAGAAVARSAIETARERLEERRERRRAEAEEQAAEAGAPEPLEAPAEPVQGPEIPTGVRKGVYDQTQDDHFAEETAPSIQPPEVQPEPEAPMVIVRPKAGPAAKDGFLARLRRRSEMRTRAMRNEQRPATPRPDSKETVPPEMAVIPEETGQPGFSAGPGNAMDDGHETNPEEVSAEIRTAAAGEQIASAEASTSGPAVDGPVSEEPAIAGPEVPVSEAEPAIAEMETSVSEAEPAEEGQSKAFSIEYSRDAKTEPEESAAEPEDARDALARAMNRALGHEESSGGAEEGPESREYRLPKVSEMLDKHRAERDGELEREIEENAKILARTLDDFRVKAEIINACHGPAVTRYELKPAPGVKVSKIENLADDLALALAAFSVRIEPVPGKAAIGIEVPNKKLEGVTLRDVLEDEAFMEAESPLTVGLGIDIGGQAIFADLGAMPHLLIAGATGSGKSVCVNTLITSILFKSRPDEVKMIMIDPKMVELSNYNGIPHLMVPVVTDSKKAASVLNWAVQEMEKRYAKFAELGVRKMADYNDAVPEDKMPAIVIIIDELADLMMVAPKDVEEAIFRLAQKARAAGIHLVLATQRPSVDVITGTIKTNIPSRISFAVSSQIDSRTILDTGGAEKLLGKGDMLFYPIGAAKPIRVQGAFISDEEIERLLEFIRAQCEEPEPDEEIMRFTEEAADKGNEKDKDKGKSPAEQTDALLGQAVDLVLSTGQASTSGIQRRFRIGYTRAGRLVDTMEELGIVGPNAGSKPREILVTKEEADRILEGLE